MKTRAEVMPREWTPKEINDLRQQHGLNQSEFGRLLYEGSGGQSAVSQLERGDFAAGAAARRTLSRLSEMDSAEVAAELKQIEERLHAEAEAS